MPTSTGGCGCLCAHHARGAKRTNWTVDRSSKSRSRFTLYFLLIQRSWTKVSSHLMHDAVMAWHDKNRFWSTSPASLICGLFCGAGNILPSLLYFTSRLLRQITECASGLLYLRSALLCVVLQFA